MLGACRDAPDAERPPQLGRAGAVPPFVDAIVAGELAAVFEAARSAGRGLSLDEAVEYALQPVEAGDGG